MADKRYVVRVDAEGNITKVLEDASTKTEKFGKSLDKADKKRKDRHESESDTLFLVRTFPDGENSWTVVASFADVKCVGWALVRYGRRPGTIDTPGFVRCFKCKGAVQCPVCKIYAQREAEYLLRYPSLLLAQNQLMVWQSALFFSWPYLSSRPVRPTNANLSVSRTSFLNY